jgi:hypothetical protein
MARIVLLDSGPLGMVTHPRPNLEIVNWLQSIIKRRIIVLVPEIADYEVRRELLRSEQFKSVRRLNDLKRNVGFLPITSKSMLKATAFGPRRAKKAILPPMTILLMRM